MSKPIPIYFEDREYVNLNDPEIQAELIKTGVAVGIPGGDIMFTQDVELIATKGGKGDGNE